MYEYNAVVNHIVDGDTVDLDIDLGFGIWQRKTRVRLYGIDAPESRTRDLAEKVYGLMAKEFVKDTIPEGSKVIVKTTLDKTGKYGRILGEIYQTEYAISINEQMVQLNLAVRYNGQSKELIQEAHLKNREILESKV